MQRGSASTSLVLNACKARTQQAHNDTNETKGRCKSHAELTFYMKMDMDMEMDLGWRPVANGVNWGSVQSAPMF